MSVSTTGSVPIEHDRWLTVRDCKRVLVVVQTITFAQRLDEVLCLLEADLRIQVVFTAPPHAFGHGVAEYLTARGISTIPWREAVRARFDLAVAASSRGLHELRAPVVRVSHGAGHIKLLTDSSLLRAGERRHPGMLSRQHLMHRGRVVPSAIAYAHERDVAALAESCPEAVPVAHVVGDPCVDRISAGLAERDRHRRALGLEGRRLVVVTSTWGPTSAFGRFDALLPHLLAQLPAPGIRVALLVHPNVWAGHGPWQMRSWLAGCRRRGVAVVPPEVDWQVLLIAADWVIGDHGSLTAYSTLTNAPVLITPGPHRAVAPGSPAALLAASAPALAPAWPLMDQLRYAAQEYRPGQYAQVAGLLSSAPGEFHRRTRALLYRTLGIGEPAAPPSIPPLPVPRPLAEWANAEPGATG